MKIKKQVQKGVGTNKDSPTVLVDADIVAYSCASAADGKFYIIDGIDGKYPLIADVKKAFEKVGKEYDRKIVHEAYEPDPLENTLHSVKVMTEGIIEFCGNGPYKLFLTGKDNYRYDVATIQPYKGNRKDKRKPAHLKECRDYLIRRWGAVVCDGQEADDMLSIEQIRIISGE